MKPLLFGRAHSKMFQKNVGKGWNGEVWRAFKVFKSKRGTIIALKIKKLITFDWEVLGGGSSIKNINKI